MFQFRLDTPTQLTNPWLVLGDSTLWAGFVASSVFQFRLANPTLTLSLTLTQTPVPQLRLRGPNSWLAIGHSTLWSGYVCVPHARCYGVCVVPDSKMVGFHSKPLCFCGSSFVDRSSSASCAGQHRRTPLDQQPSRFFFKQPSTSVFLFSFLFFYCSFSLLIPFFPR